MSFGLTIIAAMLLIYLATFMGFTSLLLIPFALLVFGLLFQLYVSRRIEHDEVTSGAEAQRIILYTFLCLAGIGIGSYVSRGLFTPPMGAVVLSVQDQMLYGTLYAISEERFFRGGLTSFVYWRTNSMTAASLSSGVIFGWPYHQAVYGTSMEKLLYVIIAGTILSFVALKTQHLSPAMLGHIGNNLFASLGGSV